MSVDDIRHQCQDRYINETMCDSCAANRYRRYVLMQNWITLCLHGSTVTADPDGQVEQLVDSVADNLFEASDARMIGNLWWLAASLRTEISDTPVRYPDAVADLAQQDAASAETLKRAQELFSVARMRDIEGAQIIMRTLEGGTESGLIACHFMFGLELVNAVRSFTVRERIVLSLLVCDVPFAFEQPWSLLWAIRLVAAVLDGDDAFHAKGGDYHRQEGNEVARVVAILVNACASRLDPGEVLPMFYTKIEEQVPDGFLDYRLADPADFDDPMMKAWIYAGKIISLYCDPGVDRGRQADALLQECADPQVHTLFVRAVCEWYGSYVREAEKRLPTPPPFGSSPG